jgi:hypothetical protein
MKRIIVRAMLLMLLSAIPGCFQASNTKSERAANKCDCLDAHGVGRIRHGIDLAQLKSIQAEAAKVFPTAECSPLWHHLTLAVDGHDLEVVSGVIVAGLQFLFVFRDGRLNSIVDPTVQCICSLTIETDSKLMLDEMQRGQDLSDDQFGDAVKTRCEQWIHYESFNEPLPATPILKSLDGGSHSRAKYLRLLGRYDATKVSLGESLQDVDAVFGTPARTEEHEDGSMTRVYGEECDIEPYWNPRVFASFRNGRVFELLTAYDVPINPPKTHYTYK